MLPMRAVVVLISLLETAGASCDGCDVSFLQAELHLGKAHGSVQRTRPSLTPIGRSFWSEDPQKSAKWWLRYSKATELSKPKPIVGLGPSSRAVTVERFGDESQSPVENLYFLTSPDWKSPKSGLGMKDFVKAAELSWASVMQRHQLYSPWTDFHDGLRVHTLYWEHLEKDRHPYQLYNDGAVGRAYIPNTSWTIEWRGQPWNTSRNDYARSVSYENPDKCRNNSNDEFPTRTFWKSTFAVLNARAAQEFALDVLGAQELVGENPYPWPPQAGCIAVQWAGLQQAGGEVFQLHFVEDFVYDTVLHSIPEFLQYQRDFLKSDASRGCVNSYMLNNLVFATESLDPFAQRLDELAVHYLALDLGDETYALLFSFPGNEGVTLQLQSHHLSHVAPRAVEFCD